MGKMQTNRFNKSSFILLIALLLGISGFWIINKGNLPTLNPLNGQEINKSNKETVRIFYMSKKPGKPDLLPLYVAQENNYFSQAGITLDESQSSFDMEDFIGDAQETVQHYDVILMGRAPSYLSEISKPGYFKAAASTYEDERNTTWAILTHQGNGINNLSQLKGRVIGLEKNSGITRKYLMPYILKKNGLNPDDFILKDVTWQDFLSGKADAFYTREPELSLALADPNTRILVDKPLTTYVMNPLPMSFLLLSTQFIQQKSEAARKVVAIWERAIDDIRANPEMARKILQKKMKEAYGLDHSNVRMQYYWKRSEIQPELLQKQINLYHEIGILPKTIDIHNLLITEKDYQGLMSH